MNRKIRINSLAGALAFLLVFVIFCFVSSAQQEGKKAEKGQYFLKRTAAPEFLVTGVNLNDLSEARFSTMNKVTESLAAQFGRVRTLFDKKNKKQVKITVAVYGSVKDAEDAALELLNSVSAVMKPGSASGNVIGTHSWYLKSPNASGAVVFIYNNSLFQMFSSDYNLAEISASSIVDDLSKGVNGVRLGRKVKLPSINDVVISEKLQKNKKAPLVMKASDPSKQKLSFAVSASKGQLVDTGKRNEKIFIPSESGASELKIYAINEANVVSPAFVKKLTVQEQE